MSMRKLIFALVVLAGAVALPSEAFAGDRDRDRNRDLGPDRSPRVTSHAVSGRINVDRSRYGDRSRHEDRGRHGDRYRRGHRSHSRVVRWTSGHWESRTVMVWIAATYRTEYVPPAYEDRRGRHGRIHRVLVRAGYNRTICIPGHYEHRVQRFWVPSRPIYHYR